MEYILIFSFYIVFLLAVSIYANFESTKFNKDYLLGGRTLGFLPVGISAASTSVAINTLLGTVGWIYINGINVGIGFISGCALGLYINWSFMAKKLRLLSAKLKVSTLTELISFSIMGNPTYVRLLISCVIIIFFTTALITLIAYGGKLLSTMYSFVSYDIGALIIIFIISLYAIVGGFLAVVWTDMIQGFFIIFIMIIFPFLYTYLSEDSVLFTIKQANLNNPILFKLTLDSLSFDNIIFSLMVVLGYLGQPHLISRFMSIENPKDIKSAALVGSISELYTQIFIFIVVICASSYFIQPILEPEMIFLELTKSLFNSNYFIAIIVVTLISLLVTTANSVLIVISSNLTQNFKLFNLKYDTKTIFRICTIMISILAYFLSINVSGNIFKFSMYAWIGVSIIFSPILFFIILGFNLYSISAILSIIIGILSLFIVYLTSVEIFFILGAVLSFVCMYLFHNFYKISGEIN